MANTYFDVIIIGSGPGGYVTNPAAEEDPKSPIYGMRCCKCGRPAR